MITAVWSFRKCKGEISRTDIILPLFSVIMWKRYHPEHKTKIYVDAEYAAEFKKFEVLQFWDEYELLPNRSDVNLEHFWSLSKFEALQRESGKVVHVDGDLIPLMNLDEVNFFEMELGVSLLEEISDSKDIAYTDSREAAKFGGLDSDEFGWDDFADQTSLFYWNNDEFKDEFLKYVFEYIRVASTKKIKHPLAYILFIEQKLFRELATQRGISKKYLIKDAYKVSNGNTLPDLTNGEIGLDEVSERVIHYGPAKSDYSTDLNMALHLSQFVIPVVGEEYSQWFWNIYSQKPYVEPIKSKGFLSKFTK